jgi:hypothetical protein
MGIKKNDEGENGKPQALVEVDSLYGGGGFSGLIHGELEIDL